MARKKKTFVEEFNDIMEALGFDKKKKKKGKTRKNSAINILWPIVAVIAVLITAVIFFVKIFKKTSKVTKKDEE